MLCLPFDVYSKVIQLYICTYSLFFRSVSCLGYHRALTGAP